MAIIKPLLILTFVGASSASAQAGMAGMHHHDEPAKPASAIARRQIDSVAKAMAKLGTTKVAANAGFRPAFGWIPTMGEHWVSQTLMMSGRQTNRATPSQLMFSKINGRDSLVGAAYAYVTADNDTVRPVIFEGAPAWHAHPDLAPAGLNLVMLHVWFVPSPDGPFAGTNPNLPFWALGLSAPDTERMRNREFNMMVRRASLALGEVADSTGIFPMLSRRDDVHPRLEARRDSVRALLSEIRAADKAKDSARWERTVKKIAAQWDGMYETYLTSARAKAVKDRVQQYTAMLLGQHAE